MCVCVCVCEIASSAEHWADVLPVNRRFNIISANIIYSHNNGTEFHKYLMEINIFPFCSHMLSVGIKEDVLRAEYSRTVL